MPRSPRVLLVAEAANPELASVPLVGWSLARALADRFEAHLVTQVRNRAAVERAGWREGREFTALDTEAVAAPLWRAGEALRRATGLGWTVTTALGALANYHFEHAAWRRFGGALRAGRFDLVHRLTPLSPTAPSLLAGRCRRAGVPFVWGPLNGGLPWPRGSGPVLRAEGEWLSLVRGAHRLLPGHRSTRAAAAATLVGSCATWAQFRGLHDRCVYVPENAVDPARFAEPAGGAPGAPPAIAFVGRLVPYKGADVLLEAAAPLVRAGRATVDVVGDGPEADALGALVRREGIEAGVRFHGWVPHARVAGILRRCRLLGLPSVREFGGGVVLEAMALGVPPVVLDYGGPAELVTEGTGVRIPMGPRRARVEGLRAALAGLVDDPSRSARMGAAARRRVARWFTWEAKARQVGEVYAWVLGARDRPDFGMPFPDA